MSVRYDRIPAGTVCVYRRGEGEASSTMLLLEDRSSTSSRAPWTLSLSGVGALVLDVGILGKVEGETALLKGIACSLEPLL